MKDLRLNILIKTISSGKINIKGYYDGPWVLASKSSETCVSIFNAYVAESANGSISQELDNLLDALSTDFTKIEDWFFELYTTSKDAQQNREKLLKIINAPESGFSAQYPSMLHLALANDYFQLLYTEFDPNGLWSYQVNLADISNKTEKNFFKELDNKEFLNWFDQKYNSGIKILVEHNREQLVAFKEELAKQKSQTVKYCLLNSKENESANTVGKNTDKKSIMQKMLLRVGNKLA